MFSVRNEVHGTARGPATGRFMNETDLAPPGYTGTCPAPGQVIRSCRKDNQWSMDLCEGCDLWQVFGGSLSRCPYCVVSDFCGNSGCSPPALSPLFLAVYAVLDLTMWDCRGKLIQQVSGVSWNSLSTFSKKGLRIEIRHRSIPDIFCTSHNLDQIFRIYIYYYCILYHKY